MTHAQYEVCVVGGGIVGASLTDALADRGVDVALFEADDLGGGSTVRSAGGIRQQFGDDRKIRLAMESRDQFAAYADESDAFDLEERGYLFLAQTEDEAAGFEADAARQQDLGLDVELLDPGDCPRFVPNLRTDDLTRGKYCPTDCVVDPGAVTRWLGERAASTGATVATGEPVTDVHTADGAVAGVETTDGRYDCDVVVNAAGVWAGAVAESVGVSLPITPARIQIVFAGDRHVPANAPFVVDVHERRYVRPATDGRTMFGGANVHEEGPADPETYDGAYDGAFVDQTATFARDRLGVADLSVVDGWAGLKGLTPDGDPLVGEVDAVEGFYVAAGWNGHGFMIAPSVSRSLAAYLDTGSWGSVDLSAYDPDRDVSAAGGAGFMDVS
jgi:sarcosine oxidase subunit beta